MIEDLFLIKSPSGHTALQVDLFHGNFAMTRLSRTCQSVSYGRGTNIVEGLFGVYTT